MDYPNMKFAFISEQGNIEDSGYTPYELMGRMPYLKSTIGNKEVLINFDTGATGWLYFPLSFKDSLNLLAPLKPWKKSWNNQTGTTNSFVGQDSQSINFGDYIIERPTIIFLPDIEDIFVGSSLLQDFKLTFYVSKQFVKMERDKESKKIEIPLQN